MGKENCKDGIYFKKVEINESTIIRFQHLGIQCVKKIDIIKSLEIREKKQIDPFGSELIVKFLE